MPVSYYNVRYQKNLDNMQTEYDNYKLIYLFRQLYVKDMFPQLYVRDII